MGKGRSVVERRVNYPHSGAAVLAAAGSPLYAPELVALGERSMLLRGFQSIDGSAYVQEWRCQVE